MPKLFVYLTDSDRNQLYDLAAEYTGGNVSLLCRAYLMLGQAAWEVLDERTRRESILASRRLGRSAGRGAEPARLPGHSGTSGPAP